MIIVLAIVGSLSGATVATIESLSEESTDCVGLLNAWKVEQVSLSATCADAIVDMAVTPKYDCHLVIVKRSPIWPWSYRSLPLPDT